MIKYNLILFYSTSMNFNIQKVILNWSLANAYFS